MNETLNYVKYRTLCKLPSEKIEMMCLQLKENDKKQETLSLEEELKRAKEYIRLLEKLLQEKKSQESSEELEKARESFVQVMQLVLEQKKEKQEELKKARSVLVSLLQKTHPKKKK